MKIFNINQNDAGQRLDKFLTKAAKLPQSLMYRAIRTNHVKVNRKKPRADTRLNEGDVVTLYLNDDLFAARVSAVPGVKGELDVAYEDENIIICDKPPGLEVHAEASRDSLIARISRYLYDKGEYDPERENSFAPALCHRLDRNTSGLVISSKNAAALREINAAIKQRQIRKSYYCAVEGIPAAREGFLEHYLFKDEAQNRVYVYDKPRKGAARAVLRYWVREARADRALVETELITGRTHQIRAQFAHIGHPLVGDGKYGKPGRSAGTGQLLRAYRLEFAPEGASQMDYLRGKIVEIPAFRYFPEEFCRRGLNKEDIFREKYDT